MANQHGWQSTLGLIVPTNTSHWPRGGLMLSQRLRRWDNSKPPLGHVSCLMVTIWQGRLDIVKVNSSPWCHRVTYVTDMTLNTNNTQNLTDFACKLFSRKGKANIFVSVLFLQSIIYWKTVPYSLEKYKDNLTKTSSVYQAVLFLYFFRNVATLKSPNVRI